MSATVVKLTILLEALLAQPGLYTRDPGALKGWRGYLKLVRIQGAK